MKQRFIVLKAKDIIYIILVTAAAIAAMAYIFGIISEMFGN